MDKNMRPVFLIGYMASGKTTLGRALARATGLRFVDLDEYVEERLGMDVRRIFSTLGEEGFRAAEARALREVASQRDVIVACGGGTPCHRGNMDFMNGAGLTVWLRVSPECVARRVTEAGDTRPLLSGVPPEELPRFVEDHMAPRMAYYSLASAVFSGEELEDEEQIRRSVGEFRRRFLC